MTVAENQGKKTLNILLVDDYPSILTANKYRLMDLLEDSGYAKSDYAIETAESGDVALAKVNEKGFMNVIISDYDMPVDGADFYLGLGSEQQKRVIFITSNDSGLRKKLEDHFREKDYKTPIILEKMGNDTNEKLDKTILDYLR